ncbi:MAG TPA: glycosyltransferase [Bacteroidales bacterium]|nr:glycosyltransferase [Bacteroidales bacterium]
MNQTPFFSIGVTTYNRKNLLLQTVLSLLNQDFSDFEIIIGNDYPDEQLTQELIGVKDDRIVIVNNDPNLGELSNMNSLLKLAKGRYFSWQFDDDLCAPVFLSEAHKALEKFCYPECVFSSFAYVYGSSNAKFTGKRNGITLYTGREFLRSYLSGRIRVLGSAGFMQTDYLRSIGGAIKLSEGKMAVYSEYFLIFKAGLLDKIAYLNSNLVVNRVHENSWSCNSNEASIYRQAGINLVRESLLIFSDHRIRKDFPQNIISLFKSVISVVITKNRMAGLHVTRSDITHFVSEIKKELKLLEDPELLLEASKCLNKSIRYIPLFRLKGYIRSIIPIKYLVVAHYFSSLVSPYTNKSF